MKLTGSRIILEVLKEHGRRVLFGYPGGAVIPLYDALYDQKDYFTHIRTSHEQGAIHGADGYARATGETGVAFVTSGPGATNAVTGIATAFMDSVPLVVISGQVPAALLGRDSFQEVDITGITLPVTKHNFLVRYPERMADTLREAFRIAASGRPGPVLVDVPKNIFMQEIRFTPGTPLPLFEAEQPVPEAVADAAARINRARKPVIYAGGGVIISGTAPLLAQLAHKAQIPVVNTLMGLGSFPRTDALSLGLVGMHGSREANLAITHADLVIAVGARFSDRVIGQVDKFAPEADIIHIDVDPTEINKNKNTHIHLLGDMHQILTAVTALTEARSNEPWNLEIAGFRNEGAGVQEGFTPEMILRAVSAAAGPEAVVATDVGQHQMWTAQLWPFSQPRQFITSGGLGTMGFGLGAALGARLGMPRTPVVLVTGDGSFRMNAMEMATMAEYDIPVLILLLNNQALGMVRQWQKLFQQGRYSETCVSQTVDYVQLAAAFGIPGFRVTDEAGLKTALAHPQLFRKPILIEAVIGKDLNVLPIVPPGMPINDLILE